MATAQPNVDVEQYLRVNVNDTGAIILHARHDAVRVVFADAKPSRSTNIYHLLDPRHPPLQIPYFSTNVWVLATTSRAVVTVTEEEPAPAATVDPGSFPAEYPLPAAQVTTLTPQTDGLTDAELRASAVNVNTGLTQPTTPADTQPVSAASLPLPTGAATAANQLPDNHQVTVSNQVAQPIQEGGAVEVHSEYLFSGHQATLADGDEIDSGWIDMSTVDKYQFEGTASVAGIDQVIESSSGPAGTGATVTTITPIPGTFQLFNVIARQRYMRFLWQNNTGSAVTNASLAIKASYGSSDKLSVLSLNTPPSDFSQSILTQSVIYGLNEATTQREQVSLSGNNNLIVALGDRISQTGGRLHHEINIIGVTPGTLDTIPAGYNFHVTSIEWAGSSTDTSNPVRARIRDGGATGELKYSLAINEPSAFAQQAGNGSQTYPEPTIFETDVYFELASGAFTGDMRLVGYLEPI